MADQSGRKCQGMRPHFPFAGPRTASESRRLFSLLSSVMAEMRLHEPGVSMATGKKMCRSCRVPDRPTLRSCCLPPVWLQQPADMLWSSNETQQRFPELWRHTTSISLSPRVLKSLRLGVYHLVSEDLLVLWQLGSGLIDSSSHGVIHLAVSLLVPGSTSAASQTVKATCVESTVLTHRHTWLVCMPDIPVCVPQLFCIVASSDSRSPKRSCVKPVTRMGRRGCQKSGSVVDFGWCLRE